MPNSLFPTSFSICCIYTDEACGKLQLCYRFTFNSTNDMIFPSVFVYKTRYLLLFTGKLDIQNENKIHVQAFFLSISRNSSNIFNSDKNHFNFIISLITHANHHYCISKCELNVRSEFQALVHQLFECVFYPNIYTFI